MTVQELIDTLETLPRDAMVYVPNSRQTCDIAKGVCPLKHLNLPEGIAISDDVFIVPWLECEMQAMQEDRREEGLT